MKRIAPIVALGLALAAGCNSSNKTQSSALQPTPASATVEAAPIAPTAPPDQGAAIDTQTPTPMTDISTGPASSSLAGGNYTIKAGDTLYRIAINHYGEGKAWKKIAAANPGLEPTKLRVGQTIVLP